MAVVELQLRDNIVLTSGSQTSPSPLKNVHDLLWVHSMQISFNYIFIPLCCAYSMTLMFSQVQILSASGMFSRPSEIVPKAQMQGINYIKTKQETSLSLKKKKIKDKVLVSTDLEAKHFSFTLGNDILNVG